MKNAECLISLENSFADISSGFELILHRTNHPSQGAKHNQESKDKYNVLIKALPSTRLETVFTLRAGTDLSVLDAPFTLLIMLNKQEMNLQSSCGR